MSVRPDPPGIVGYNKHPHFDLVILFLTTGLVTLALFLDTCFG